MCKMDILYKFYLKRKIFKILDEICVLGFICFICYYIYDSMNGIASLAVIPLIFYTGSKVILYISERSRTD